MPTTCPKECKAQNTKHKLCPSVKWNILPHPPQARFYGDFNEASWMVRLLDGDGQTYEWFLITQLPPSHCKFSMWSGNIIWDYYKTNVILDKSMLCFVNPRGCMRNLEGIQVWLTCSFDLAFSTTQCCLTLFKVLSQWFSVVDFSQTTEPFTALMSVYTDRSVWNPLGVLRWKKKKAPLL